MTPPGDWQYQLFLSYVLTKIKSGIFFLYLNGENRLFKYRIQHLEKTGILPAPLTAFNYLFTTSFHTPLINHS